MVSGAVHRSPDFYLIAEENPRKPNLGDRQMKPVWPVIASNGVPSLQMKAEGGKEVNIHMYTYIQIYIHT